MAKRDLRQIKADKKKLNREDIKEAARKANLNTDVSGADDGQIQSMEDTIKKYENKSEGEMMSDLEKMVAQGRKDGTFTDEMLGSFIKNVSPMMDSAQRKKLENIARMIRMNQM